MVSLCRLTWLRGLVVVNAFLQLIADRLEFLPLLLQVRFHNVLHISGPQYSRMEPAILIIHVWLRLNGSPDPWALGTTS